ncbi:hypothetical protein [Motilimonas cestriensis]|uniref:hypothetical protein n=1 Tax=Motilimonas cestriensis TaxID=2742685 RepID=UPI003DA46D29
MEFCILSKGDVLVAEDITKTETAEIILALFKQGFVLAPILIEANNAENARLVFINRFQWQELGEAMTNRQLLKG